MQLREKIGQLLMLGSDREDPTGFVEQLAQLRAGGAVLFSRDIKDAQQLRGLNDSISERVEFSCGIRPFIAIDQEGGRVARLRGELCPALPANEVHGELFETDPSAAIRAVEEQASLTARVMLDLHLNMNLAPVCDVLKATESEVLASRCYSSDTETVSRLASAYATKLQKSGVAACAKHFPGHGGTVVDSHLHLPVVDTGLDALEQVQLPPFKRLIDEGVAAVMTAHIVFSRFDSQPATMSRVFVQDLLLDSMQHRGMVLTDDMMMGAVMNETPVPDACLQALQAGISLLLICSSPADQTATVERIIQAVNDGELSEDQIDRSVERNLEVKRRFGIS
ncbi:beta-N-acetylhexosaminidase [bacterium]|nr:beta-N-acetylhexosaminidase [bacterium]